MKKVLLATSLVLLTVILFACSVKTTTTTTTTTTSTTTTTTTTTAIPTDNDPVILGAEDVTIEKNSTFIPLKGITATDVEDGNLTDRVTYSGNVNPNAIGVYTATYTVTDNDGNVTVVERTITVVFTDVLPPLIIGTANETIYVGELFDALAGVVATDTVEGVVDVTVTGSVNIWLPGVYTLNYSAKDASDNEATATRTVTVTFGDFVFGSLVDVPAANFTVAEGVMHSPAISGGVVNTNIADFTFVKVVLTASATTNGNIELALGSSRASLTELALTSAVTEYTVYFVITSALVSAELTIDLNGLTVENLNVDYAFAEIRDMVAPVLNVPDDKAAYAVGNSQAGLEALLLAGVTAVDNIDGNITSSVIIYFGALDLDVVGEYDIVYTVTDAGDNSTTFTRRVTIGNLVDSGYITDGTFQNLGDGQFKHKGGEAFETIAFNATEGIMTVLVNQLGTYPSAAGVYFKQSTADLEIGQWYCFTMTVKTSIARTMGFRIGLATNQANAWVDEVDGNNNKVLNLTSEYQTFNIYFQLDSLTSTAGYAEFYIELNLGMDLYWSNIGTGGTTTFKEIYLHKVVTEFEDPTFTENFGPAVDMPTTFTVGDTAPDWATYLTALDMSKNILSPSIDSTAVNMAVAGTYDIVYSVTDTHDLSATYTLSITVVEVADADTVGPVITKAAGLPEVLTFDQFSNYVFDYTLLVTITDAVDGLITPTLSMVDNDDLSMNVAGVYTVVYTCYDKSGNLGTASFVVTIVDKEAPVIAMSDKTINIGEIFNARNGLVVTDNVDGTIDNMLVTISGFEAFTDVNGIVDVAGTFTVTYDYTDAAGNVATQKSIIVTVTNIIWDTTKTIVLSTPNEIYHCVGAIDALEGAYAITNIVPVVYSWDQPARLVYYFNNTQLIKGQTYMFEIEVKATTATLLNFRIGSALSVDPWIDNFNGGLQTISITDEYVTYRVLFTVNKDIANGSQGVKFQFQYGYQASDSTNTIYVKSFKLVPEKQPTYLQVADLTPNDAFTGIVGNGITIGTDTIESAATISHIPAYTYDWTTGKLTYYFNSSVLTYGETYRFAVTMKALTATKVRFWIGTGLNAEPWIDSFTGANKTDVQITSSYVTYYIVFTADAASFQSNPLAKLEFTIGYNDDAANILYVKDFIIEHIDPSDEVAEITLFDAIASVNGGTVSAPTYALAADVQAVLPTTVKAHFNDVTIPVLSWTDTDSYNPAVAGSYTFTAVLGTLPDGFANTANITVSVEVVVGSDTPVVSFNDFESYADTAAFVAATDNINGIRLGSGTFVRSYGEILMIETNKVLSMGIAAGTNGIKINITKASLPATTKYIGFWVKATDLTGIVKFQSFIYSATGYTEITSQIVGGISKLAGGTYVYVPVSALQNDTIVLSMVLNCSSTTSGKIYFDNIVLMDNLPVNAAPVVSITPENIAILSGMTFKAGESLESTIAALLPLISINDAEDGVIPATVAMLNSYNLNILNPVMGTYHISITAKDSDGKASNVYTIAITVVTVIQDFESFADDAAFKAGFSFTGFRIGGGSWLPSSGSLVTIGDENVLQSNYSTGTNGIRINLTKAQLVALGAQYVGIYIKTSTVLTGTVSFQAFGYSSTFAQITINGNINYSDEGTYVYIPVSALTDAMTSISIMINVTTGNTGVMTYDNIVIK